MAHKIALRTDKAFPEVKAWIESKSLSGWAVREVSGDNEHWHWYLETDMKLPAFRVALTRAVPVLKGNACYSASEVKDVDKYLRYMAKGESDGAGPEWAWRHGLMWTDEKLEELHADYWVENRKLKKRRATGPVMDAVYDKCKETSVRWDDKRAIFEAYIRELVARDKPINLFSVKASVNLLAIKLCPNDDALQCLVDATALI